MVATAAVQDAAASNARPMSPIEKRVVFAASLGTVFEWYDFYLYGALTTIIADQFFDQFPRSTREIFALLAFAAGFIVRPLGAVVFGRIGDLVGRKYTFLIAILIMGLSTFLVGLLPGSRTIGVTAPILLVVCKAWRSAANTAARRPIWPNTRPTAGAASTRPGCRPPRRSACSCRWSSSCSSARCSARRILPSTAGASRSSAPSCCWRSRCGFASSSASPRPSSG